MELVRWWHLVPAIMKSCLPNSRLFPCIYIVRVKRIQHEIYQSCSFLRNETLKCDDNDKVDKGNKKNTKHCCVFGSKSLTIEKLLNCDQWPAFRWCDGCVLHAWNVHNFLHLIPKMHSIKRLWLNHNSARTTIIIKNITYYQLLLNESQVFM